MRKFKKKKLAGFVEENAEIILAHYLVHLVKFENKFKKI